DELVVAELDGRARLEEPQQPLVLLVQRLVATHLGHAAAPEGEGVPVEPPGPQDRVAAGPGAEVAVAAERQPDVGPLDQGPGAAALLHRHRDEGPVVERPATVSHHTLRSAARGEEQHTPDEQQPPHGGRTHGAAPSFPRRHAAQMLPVMRGSPSRSGWADGPVLRLRWSLTHRPTRPRKWARNWSCSCGG